MKKEEALELFKNYCMQEDVDESSLQYIRDIEPEEMLDFAKLDNGWQKDTLDTSPKNEADLRIWYDQGFSFTSCEVLDEVTPCVILKVNDRLGGYICSSPPS